MKSQQDVKRSALKRNQVKLSESDA
jgi:hypothetical protein